MDIKATIHTFLLLSCFYFKFEFSSAAFSSITTANFLRDGTTLVSSNGNFALGFFGPNNSTNRYLGIWFNNKNNSKGMLEVKWVANRDTLLKDSYNMVKLSDNRNLELVDSRNNTIWSSNISNKVTSLIARLLNTGNLILFQNGSIDSPIWQSFDYPTDSVLPGHKFSLTKGIADNKLQSWKTSIDQSEGKYRLVSLSRGLPEFAIVDVDTEKIYWRTVPWNNYWNGYLFPGVPNYYLTRPNFGFMVDDHNGILDFSFKGSDPSDLLRLVLDYDGSLRAKNWDVEARKWVSSWQSLTSECDVYGKCGKFAVCDATKAIICECLMGFEPEKVDEWRNGNWTNGCVRKTRLHECGAKGEKEDRFLQLKQMKVPDYATWFQSDPDVCEAMCLDRCSCIAYTTYDNIGCMLWNVSLVDVQQFYGFHNADLFIRLAYSELPSELPGHGGKHGKSRKRFAVIIVIFSVFVLSCLMYFLWRWISRKYGRNNGKTATKEEQWQNILDVQMETGEFHDLPLFEFTKLVAATNNFSIINKLGQGGFGPVYKGILEDGQENAVKRLSKASGQGVQEFMNEVVVISKLQHINLVRLLGCCVEGDEKLLVYEFMPNKSLDAILFHTVHCKRLDWLKRFEIIQGICRGLLYLHRDSRLRIIHRDLKPSNILLDEELNPKISDFGTARIFGNKQDQANTLRVVGTYGYMSPEYAMEGRFSEKSDVYSLGIILLEIVSGRRNNFKENMSLDLLVIAWKLWNEENTLSLIDPTIVQPCFEEQIVKCIKVGLLCVQESSKDRPNVSELMLMLEVENVENLPFPEQPGFVRTEDYCSTTEASQNDQELSSVNDASVTTIIGR